MAVCTTGNDYIIICRLFFPPSVLQGNHSVLWCHEQTMDEGMLDEYSGETGELQGWLCSAYVGSKECLLLPTELGLLVVTFARNAQQLTAAS